MPDPTRTDKALYALKLRSNGDAVWVHAFDGHVAGFGLAADGKGHTWLGGGLTGSLWLDDEPLGAPISNDVFLLRFGP